MQTASELQSRLGWAVQACDAAEALAFTLQYHPPVIP
jgi:hypothetical protein